MFTHAFVLPSSFSPRRSENSTFHGTVMTYIFRCRRRQQKNFATLKRQRARYPTLADDIDGDRNVVNDDAIDKDNDNDLLTDAYPEELPLFPTRYAPHENGITRSKTTRLNTTVAKQEDRGTHDDIIEDPVEHGKDVENDADRNNENDGSRQRRYLSPESRAKISAALKGRRKSDSHREKLRQRLSGERNPMYGRKRSAESRAKISRSLTERHRKEGKNADKVEEEDAATVSSRENLNDPETLKNLQDAAQKSRLVESIQRAGSRRGNARQPRDDYDDVKEQDVEHVLRRVARLDQPPENVARLLRETREKNQSKHQQTAVSNDGTMSNTTDLDDPNMADDSRGKYGLDITDVGKHSSGNGAVIENSAQKQKIGRGRRKHKRPTSQTRTHRKTPEKIKCDACKGNGITDCPDCVGAFGLVSSRCPTCFGAGAAFCNKCDGVGLLPENP